MKTPILSVTEALVALQGRLKIDLPQRERLLPASELLSKRAILWVGPQGTGKTTYVLSLLKQLPGQFFHVSLKNPLMAGVSLFELGDWVFRNGYDVLVCDEVQYDPAYFQALKALYEAHGHSKIWALTHSVPNSAEPFWVQKFSYLSFRESMWLKKGVLLPEISYNELVTGDLVVAQNEINQYFWGEGRHVQEEFQNYLKVGMRPFFEESNWVDIPVCQPTHFNLMRHIIGYLALSETPSIKIESLSLQWGVSKLTAYNLLQLLENIGLINILRYEGAHQEHSKGAQIFFSDPSLYAALGGFLGHVQQAFFVMQLRNIGQNPVCPKDNNSYDYRVGSHTFEINSSQKAKKADFWIREDIEAPSKQEIPLWLLGFLKTG